VLSGTLDKPIKNLLSTELLLTRYLGILEPTLVELPEGATEERRELGNFEVAVCGETAVLHCYCGRLDPLPVSLQDLDHASPVQGLLACPACVEESLNAKSRTQMVESWIRRRRNAIDPNQHLYLPEKLQRLAAEGKIMRPKRYVYQVFFNIELKSDDHVLSTCNDKSCLNPYHLIIGKSPARKMSPSMKEDVLQWLAKNVSTQTIITLLKTKYGKVFSERTIQLLKKEFRQSDFTKTYSNC
jgi:hypothetical protein